MGRGQGSHAEDNGVGEASSRRAETPGMIRERGRRSEGMSSVPMGATTSHTMPGCELRAFEGRRQGEGGRRRMRRMAGWALWVLVTACLVQHADTGTGGANMEWVSRRLSQEFASTIKKAPPPSDLGGRVGIDHQGTTLGGEGKQQQQTVCEEMTPSL